MYSSAMRMKAAHSSEMLVDFYQTTQCYNQEDNILQVLFCIFSAGHFRIIPNRPVCALPDHLQIQFKDQGMVRQALRD
jgi:hypothetical protein